jgi:hypothetical protein
MTSTIDWDGQLEAEHRNGTVKKADRFRPYESTWPDSQGQYHVSVEGMLVFANQDGSEWPAGYWRIRNTAQEPSKPILTSTEALDRFEALLGRLEAAVGAISKGEVK